MSLYGVVAQKTAKPEVSHFDLRQAAIDKKRRAKRPVVKFVSAQQHNNNKTNAPHYVLYDEQTCNAQAHKIRRLLCWSQGETAVVQVPVANQAASMSGINRQDQATYEVDKKVEKIWGKWIAGMREVFLFSLTVRAKQDELRNNTTLAR